VWLHASQSQNGKPAWLGKRTSNARIKVGHYHTIAQPKGNLYQAVRKVTGMPRSTFSKALGITEYQLRYRERVKRTYHLCEILALFVASGMTWDDYGELLNDVA
jgi:hypothetical protein